MYVYDAWILSHIQCLIKFIDMICEGSYERRRKETQNTLRCGKTSVGTSKVKFLQITHNYTFDIIIGIYSK